MHSETQRSAEQRGQWSSEPAFVFSMAAAAVGLGAKGRRWEYRIFIVGRSLPFIAAAFALWRVWG